MTAQGSSLHFEERGLLRRLSSWVPLRLLCYALGILAVVVIATILTRLLVPPAPSPWHSWVILKNVLLPIAAFALYAWLVKLLEQRPAREIDLRRGFTFLPGALAGAAMMALFFLILWSLGLAQVSKGTGVTGLASEMIAPMVTAMGEELLFRAVLFRLLEEMSGTTTAIVVSAIVFGLAHAGNPGASAFSIAALAMDMGVLLALAYILTRNIWFAVGIHMGWNFTEGYIFGALNSGMRDPHSLLSTTLTGPQLITGGSFGPEGSILMVGICIAASVMMLVSIRRRGGWEAPRLRLRVENTSTVAP
ncbi:MAG TPA: type II CAAX endopeptidase family protein [Candidatus Eremiobacteraceae bacterium]